MKFVGPLAICSSSTKQNRRKLIALIGLAIGLLAFGPWALQGVSLMRAAQYETNENRTQYETNERHSTILPARCARMNGTMAKGMHSVSKATDALQSVRRAFEAKRLSVPAVVDWSPSLRC